MLAEIHRHSNRFPQWIPVSSETLSQYAAILPASLLFILKCIFSALGLAPINRGNRSRGLKEHGAQALNRGQCLSIFPEGEINLGPRVFPMQKGAVEMALKAVSRQLGLPPELRRPILLQRFAHVWLYDDFQQSAHAMRKTVAQLERQLMGGKTKRSLSNDVINVRELHTRLFILGTRLMERVRNAHALTPPVDWTHMDFWQRARWLQVTGLSALETKYGLNNDASRTGRDRLIHNRLMKIRTKIWERRAKNSEQTSSASRNVWTHDLKRADDLSILNTFMKDDLTTYGNGKRLDNDMLAVYLRRLCRLAGWRSEPSLGRRRVVVRLLKPIDMHQYANEYIRLATELEKEQFAIKLTKDLLEIPIQKAINQLRQKCLNAVR